jgi:hypothetical protein
MIPLLALLLMGALWLGSWAAARRALGPPGFLMTRRAAPQAPPIRSIAPALFAPDLLAPLPPGGMLEASGVFLADQQGRYAFFVGSTAPVQLHIDGRLILAGTLWRAKTSDVELTAGLHEIALRVDHSDGEGGLVLAVRPPGVPWHAHLIGAGDVLALPIEAARARLGAHPAAWIWAARTAPWAIVLLAMLVALAAAGSERRALWQKEAAALAGDEAARRCASALVGGALVLAYLAPLFTPGYYACHEEESYLVRLYEFVAAWRAGVPMGRWWADPVLGRGYPFLCLYAPLLYLLSAPLALAGAPLLDALKAVSAATVSAGAWAIYRLIRRHAGR